MGAAVTGPVPRPEAGPAPVPAERPAGPVTESHPEAAGFPLAGLAGLRQATLLVGASDDPSEVEAEAMARRIVDGAEADAHRHTDGCCGSTVAPVQRSTDVHPAAPIGAAGGEVQTDTEQELLASRGGGAPLPAGIRRSMESGFGADFSAVRVHSDARAARLNQGMSARAFTLGSDIYLGPDAPSPQSREGRHLLAHELTHVVQQSAPAVRRQLDAATRSAVADGVRRTQVINRFTLPWRKTQEQKDASAAKAAAAQAEKERAAQAKAAQVAAARRAQEVTASRVDGGKTLGEFSARGRKQLDSENTRIKAMTDYADGMGGRAASTPAEIGKPAAAITATAATGAGVQFGQGVSGLASPAANMVLSPLLLGDAALGLNSARKMNNEAALYGDKGMGNLAGRKAKDQGQALLGASLATTRAGVGIGAKVGAMAGSAALATAGGALGVAGGSAQVLQGMWRGGKAVMKLCRLAWGRAAKMISERGAQWKQAIVSAERYKAAIAALKMTLGALGIAAGALLIVSNPIGWGLGIAAAIAGGVYAATKIAGKIKNASDRTKAAEAIAAGKKSEEVFASEVEAGDGAGPASPSPFEPRPAAPTAKAKKGSGFAVAPGAKPATHAKRSQAIEDANEVARMASSHAQLAGELRGALSAGDKGSVAQAIEHTTYDPKFKTEEALTDDADRELHDSFLLLSSINVDPDEALSESGQDLIEKKLSKTEAM